MVVPDRRVGADGKERPTTYKRQDPEQEKEVVPNTKPKMTKKECAALPPAQGMAQAQRAVWELEEIEDNDVERQAAFDYVRRWLDEHKKA
ncbi:MAG: hypothetical protein ACYTEQ_30540 [Planctomycetota bacterium]